MTGPEQHANTVREDSALLADWAEEPTAISSVDADNCRARIMGAVAALVALAERADTLERHVTELEGRYEVSHRRVLDYASELDRERASRERLEAEFAEARNRRYPWVPQSDVVREREAREAAERKAKERLDALDEAIADLEAAERERDEAREMYGRAADRMTIEIIEREAAEADNRRLRALIEKPHFVKGAYLCRYCWQSDGHAEDCEARAAAPQSGAAAATEERCSYCHDRGQVSGMGETVPCPRCTEASDRG